MQRLGSIYVLIEPQTGEIRYVGQTIGLMKHRLYKHHHEGKTSAGTSHEGRAGNGWTTGAYTADPISCIVCRKVCKGRSALSCHITKTKNHVGAL